MHVALTIAGSDPSGGAGIQADLKTFHQRGVYGTSVLTLLTVQNTQGVQAIRVLEPEFVLAQLEAVLSDIPPAAAKTGALGNEAVIEALADRARSFRFPLVVDPVMISKHGAPLVSEDARAALATHLLPCAFLVTPNLHEAAVLAGMPVDDISAMFEAARRIRALGVSAVLVKGGHLENEALDVLHWKGNWFEFRAPRIGTVHTHGTGCTFSAAITAELAKGAPLPEAVATAKKYISSAIRSGPGLGQGIGPVNHHADI
ncbi:MAG: bifunctional hydroxymethylpyrimidine kinase/phosphomethylpyrimidine kinase [Acidobacteria bacterium]|nr:bifunctional hydroxymethylpyrimidine kinase/phosphomethylpyrimidine kinase [Acidobacteriota bacterium]